MVKDRIAELKKTLASAKATVKVLKDKKKATLKKISDLENTLSDTEKAREIILLVGRDTQQMLEIKVSGLVTLALEAVFPDPYEFKVVFEERRNSTEADLFFCKNDDLFKPLDSSGGGAIDIASFALRVSDWKLRGTRNVLIMDEPFRNLSADLQPKASEMLHRISSDLGLQIIMVSHQEGVNEECDRLFSVKNGETTQVW